MFLCILMFSRTSSDEILINASDIYTSFGTACEQRQNLRLLRLRWLKQPVDWYTQKAWKLAKSSSQLQKNIQHQENALLKSIGMLVIFYRHLLLRPYQTYTFERQDACQRHPSTLLHMFSHCVLRICTFMQEQEHRLYLVVS